MAKFLYTITPTMTGLPSGIPGVDQNTLVISQVPMNAQYWLEDGGAYILAPVAKFHLIFEGRFCHLYNIIWEIQHW